MQCSGNGSNHVDVIGCCSDCGETRRSHTVMSMLSTDGDGERLRKSRNLVVELAATAKCEMRNAKCLTMISQREDQSLLRAIEQE